MPRAFWLIIIGHMINTTGSSFLWPLNTIYLNEQLGKSLTIAGIVLMLNAAATVIGNLTGGYLFDKLGGYRSIMIGAGISLASLIGLTFWHGWPHYVFFLILVGFGTGVVNPTIYALAGVAWKEGGRRAFNAMYVAQNVGVALGSSMAGFIAAISFDFIFISNLAMYILFFLIASFSYRNISAVSVRSSVSVVDVPVLAGNDQINKNRFRALMIISIGYALCWVGYVQWQTTIATYTQQINISLEQYSLLWTVNGVLIVLAQPLLSIITNKFVRNLKMQILVGTIIFIFAFSIASVSTDFNGFLAAMIIMTCGELFVWPAIPTIADKLAPKGKEGFYQGIVNSAATGGRMIGPILGGVLVDVYGMEVLFIVLIGLFIISIFSSLFYDKGLKKERRMVEKVS